MKYLFSVLIIVSFVFSQTTTKIGDNYFNSDGSSTTKIGDNYFNSDGSSTTKIGDTYFNSNKNKTQSYILDNETNEQETDPWNK